MKLSIALSLLTYIASISAETHQYCCCSSKTKNQCLHDETTWVRDYHKGPEVWKFYDGTFSDSDGAPFNCNNCYLYASLDHGDGLIGGEQMSNECDKYSVGSSCFDPPTKDEDKDKKKKKKKKKHHPPGGS
ncbi:hypothetical protein E2P81_ATG03815 [Venturia nashicola]|nr:hypothetical protein E2P81_ATG03815 [Venturia nashicola]